MFDFGTWLMVYLIIFVLSIFITPFFQMFTGDENASIARFIIVVWFGLLVLLGIGVLRANTPSASVSEYNWKHLWIDANRYTLSVPVDDNNGGFTAYRYDCVPYQITYDTTTVGRHNNRTFQYYFDDGTLLILDEPFPNGKLVKGTQTAIYIHYWTSSDEKSDHMVGPYASCPEPLR